MKNITRTIIVSTVEIYNKKNFAVPAYVATVYTDDETEAEKVAIKEYLMNAYDNDNERKKTKNTLFGVVTNTATYKGEIPLGLFVQSCIDYGTFEKIEK